MEGQLPSAAYESQFPATGLLGHGIPAGGHSDPADELVLRHVRSASDRAAVEHLRCHIDLALHKAIDPDFLTHEKKETNSV